MEIPYYILLAVNSILAIEHKKNRFVAGISFIFLLILFAGNTLNGDYYSYLYPYLEKDFSDFEIGYQIIASIFSGANLNYNIFLLFVGISCYGLIIYIFNKKFGSSLHVFFSLYFPIILFYDINQIRNFILTVFLIFAISLLFRGKKIWFVTLLFIASLFQMLALAYIPLAFLVEENDNRKYRQKNLIKIIVILSMILSILTFFNGKRIPFLYSFFSIILGENSEKLVYFSSNTMQWGFVLTYIMQFANVILILNSYRNLKINNVDREKQKFVFNSLIVNCYGFVTFPFLMINLTFYRVFRNFSFLNYIVVALTISSFYNSNHAKSRRYILYIIQIALYCLIWKYGIIIKYGEPLQIEMILNNNLLLNL
ncbi:EpsG family protein [Lachnospiraceae bacterium 56-18]